MTDYELDLDAIKALYTQSRTAINWAGESAMAEAATWVPALVTEIEALQAESARGYEQYAKLRSLYVDCLAARDGARRTVMVARALVESFGPNPTAQEEALRAAVEDPEVPYQRYHAEDDAHAPWTYTEFGVLCCCGSAMDSDENCLSLRPAEAEETMPSIFARRLRKARRQRDAAQPVIEAARRLAACGELGWHDERFRAAVHATIAALIAYERGET